MKAHILISLCLTAALSTSAITTAIRTATAASKPKQSDLADLVKSVAELQSDVKALQDTVAKLASSQGAAAAQLQDVSRRLYATCALTQRLMDVTVPGGWSENALCNYKGLTAAGPAVDAGHFRPEPDRNRHAVRRPLTRHQADTQVSGRSAKILYCCTFGFALSSSLRYSTELRPT